ncbi:sterol desaturase family protein [Erythrobacter sp. BLCC-B19]|uniref:sterol desaturase family protein n=1 Tax=Erythrobacter sp. BLCC-B19 TaxID=3025315 RepID=UPI002360CD83|nr:sterol desaturase family protein [Erythrobacter sp. BLCC-B19]WDA40473.1 sterol desaturase family protein [Erythrobacter sp. BLCC-B19]
MTIPADPATLEYATNRVADHFMFGIYFDLSRYLIAAGVLTVLLLVFRGFAEIRRIQVGRRANRADYQREILSSMRTVVVYAVVTLAILVGRETGVILLKLQNATAWTIAWQVVLMVLAHDAWFYWAHRAMHSKRLFRATHLHHHKSRTPTPWTAYSFTMTEAVIEVAFVPVFLFVTSQLGIAYAGYAILIFIWHQMIRNVMAHAGSELFPAGWVDNPWTDWIATTTHHDLHHSSGHNFGFYFTWWDRWMGTEHPRYREAFREVTTRQRGAQPVAEPAE